MNLIFKCRRDNDLYRVFCDMGHSYPRYDSADKAIENAASGQGVLILADDYPRPASPIDAHVLKVAAERKLRLYIEYPASIPSLEFGEPRRIQWERLIVSSDFFAPHVEKLTILAQHGCWFLPVQADLSLSHLMVGKVAGYDKAVYGLPDTSSPILFPFMDGRLLVATTKLSHFVKGRYGPASTWAAIWKRILTWISGCDQSPDLAWEPEIQFFYDKEVPLNETAERDTFKRSIEWFSKNIVYSIGEKTGAIEGFDSEIDHQGRQLPRPWPRADCISETAMAFAYDWTMSGNPASKRTAERLIDYVWSSPDFYQDDPDSPAYGLNNWYERGPVFYGDDNARLLLASLAVGKALDQDRWDEKILRCLLANLRTTGPDGFRFNRISLADFYKDRRGWQYFRDTEYVMPMPHYQAYLWAAFLWAYALTGYEPFAAKANEGIHKTMVVYPMVKWTNGLTQEMARMLLPLAFLIRIKDTPEHRNWLNRLADDLLEQMQPCGAIVEKMGDIQDGKYASPRSNDDYGTTEASIIQNNGNACCDLLYTMNWAFLGFHEAAAVTGDSKLKKAEDRLADFLCRVQIKSVEQPYLNGAWMRAFDYKLWEYWGSSADLDWGPWCVESGWSNSWFASIFAMRQLGESLFDLTLSKRLKKHFPKLANEMFEDRPLIVPKDMFIPNAKVPGAE